MPLRKQEMSWTNAAEKMTPLKPKLRFTKNTESIQNMCLKMLSEKMLEFAKEHEERYSTMTL